MKANTTTRNDLLMRKYHLPERTPTTASNIYAAAA